MPEEFENAGSSVPATPDDSPTAVPGTRQYSDVEREVAALLAEYDDVLDVDPMSADTSMDYHFETRMWAFRRMVLVRDANVLRLDMAGNKIANPPKAAELEKQYNATLWQIAAVDKLFPDARESSMAMMRVQALEEQSIEDEKREKLEARYPASPPSRVRRRHGKG